LPVAVAVGPGITLAESDAPGRQVEESLLAFSEVVSTSRRTGRAERDEHLQGVNGAEIEVVLRRGRPKDELLAQMRRAVATIPGVSVTFGQPISHRHRENLGNLPVLAEGGRVIRLGDVARIRQDLGPSIVRREDVRRVAVLTANISGRDLTGTVDAAREALEAELDLPSGYRLVLGVSSKVQPAASRSSPSCRLSSCSPPTVSCSLPSRVTARPSWCSSTIPWR